VCRNQIAEQIQLGSSGRGEVGAGCGLEAGPAGKLGYPAQQRATESIVFQQPVPVGTQHMTTVAALVRIGHQGRLTTMHDPAVVDLVAADRLAERGT
jgi:hypothetical protein